MNMTSRKESAILGWLLAAANVLARAATALGVNALVDTLARERRETLAFGWEVVAAWRMCCDGACE